MTSSDIAVDLLLWDGRRRKLFLPGDYTVHSLCEDISMARHMSEQEPKKPLVKLFAKHMDEVLLPGVKLVEIPTNDSQPALLSIHMHSGEHMEHQSVECDCAQFSNLTYHVRKIVNVDKELVKQCHAIGKQQRRAAAAVMEACASFSRDESTEAAYSSKSSCCMDEDGELYSSSEDCEDVGIDDENSLLPTPSRSVPSSAVSFKIQQWVDNLQHRNSTL